MDKDKFAYDIYILLWKQHFMRRNGQVSRDVDINGRFRRMTSYAPCDYSFTLEDTSDILIQWLRTLSDEQLYEFSSCTTWNDIRKIKGLIESLCDFYKNITLPLGSVYGL